MTAPFRRTSLERFFAYVIPYRKLVVLAVMFGVIRYLIPLALPWTLKVLVDDFLSPRSTHPRPRLELHLLMVCLIVLYVVYGLVSYWRSYLAGVAGHRLIFDLRRDLYQHIQRMSLSFFDRQRIGEVVARMTSDIASAQNFVGAAFVNTAMDLASIVAIIGVLWVAQWKLALVAFLVLPCYAVISRRLTRQIKRQSRAIHDQLEEISGELHEQMGAIATIQSFTREEAEARAFDRQSHRYLRSVLESVRLQSISLGVTGFLTALGPILVLWFGAELVLDGHLTIGTLMAFYGYLGLLYQPVQRLAELSLVLSNSRAAMDRIFEVFDTYPDVREQPEAVPLPRVRGEIGFESVSFHYGSHAPVLDRITLRLTHGTTAALVGPSGAGKSTLVKLLPRFYDATRGRVLLDGVDVRDTTLKSLRQNIAVVAQEPLLVSGSIAENLRYGRPDASDADIEQAARLAFAHEFIERLPSGYDTDIGERGLRLSGGQKQRLAIARAFLKDAPVLILDEPTSALDPESETLIKQALIELRRGRTALIIAHRLSTIEHVDEVLVLDRGRVVDRGPHRLLLEREGIYRRYATAGIVAA